MPKYTHIILQGKGFKVCQKLSSFTDASVGCFLGYSCRVTMPSCLPNVAVFLACHFSQQQRTDGSYVFGGCCGSFNRSDMGMRCIVVPASYSQQASATGLQSHDDTVRYSMLLPVCFRAVSTGHWQGFWHVLLCIRTAWQRLCCVTGQKTYWGPQPARGTLGIAVHVPASRGYAILVPCVVSGHVTYSVQSLLTF